MPLFGAKRTVIGGLTPNGDWASPLLSSHPFNYDEQFLFESTGGGGWGKPHDRPASKVLDDVLDDYISIEAARHQCGVAIDPTTMTINAAETARLRGAKSQPAKRTGPGNCPGHPDRGATPAIPPD